jgi:DNA-binding GntR family transcriptional regulator
MSIGIVHRDVEAPATLATGIYERLKADILSAQLEPGRKLQLRFLMEHYGAGQTPLREALNRLTTEDLVVGKEQRGFFVQSISLEELAELTKTRGWVEGTALRESIANATPAWEEALLVAHHRLDRTPRSLNPDNFENNPEWERCHRKFHALLIGNCRLSRYRALSSRKSFRVRKVGEEHDALLRAVLDAKSEIAVELLVAHYGRTAAFIQQGISNPA